VQERLHELRMEAPAGTKLHRGERKRSRKAVQTLKFRKGSADNVSSTAHLLHPTPKGGKVSGIRTNAAAELLGVSPNTLRSWERRFGYPKPRRTQGGHRQYDLTELEALRRALLETHNISSAIEVARQRGEGPSSPTRLVDAFDHFDEQGADRVMEESLAVRSVERSVEEVLLPAIELAQGREGREAEHELACRWATGWLHAARRVVAPATRPQGVLVFDSSERLDLESLHVQGLELALRRAGFRTLQLAATLPPERVGRAMRALDPTAFVFCGGEATLEVVGRLVYTVRQVGSAAPVFEYRESMPVTGDHAIPSLGSAPTEAADRLKAYVDNGRIEPVVAVPPSQKTEAGAAPVKLAARQ
jgi:MerR family transcriptional regulator, light-induced transcriptional regulator